MKRTTALLILGSITLLVLCACSLHKITNVVYTYSGEDVRFIDFDIDPPAREIRLNDVECLLVSNGTHARCAVSAFSEIVIEGK